MRFATIAQPATEPVTPAELRAHVRVDDAADDALLLGYLVAARQMAETFMGRPILPTVMQGQIEEWPEIGPLYLDAPVLTVDAVTYTDAAGATVAWTNYIVRPAPGRLKAIRAAAGATWPTLGDDPVIAVTITAGWALDLVPADVCTAILQTAAHFYANRESVNIGNITNEIPDTGKALLRPYRWRLIG
jgi:uncharacterized phiE125 gp8 family phage protein